MATKKECEKAIDEVCKKCFEKHELEYGQQPVNCAFREFDNEDCPTVKVLKDLIQEHFDGKSETNFEHYKDEIIENCDLSLALFDRKPCKCSSVKCSDCGFSTGHGCSEKIKEWLKKPYEKQTYKLSRFEYDLINAYDRCKECCLLNEIKALKRMSEKGYFKGIDPFTKVHEILDNCEVIK